MATQPILVSTTLSQAYVTSQNIVFIVSLTPDITKYNVECPEIPYYIYGDLLSHGVREGDAITAATAIHAFYESQGEPSVIFTLDVSDPRIADIQQTYTELYG